MNKYWLSGIIFLAYGLASPAFSSETATCNQVNHLIPTRVLVKGGEITCKMLK
ncbi:DUF2574 family protein [Escherichia coli]|nr:DUF2574 family protein [Escherichia coli]